MVSINHKKKCVFFHVPKTAGSYIQGRLNKTYDFVGYNYLSRYDLVDMSFNSNFFNHQGPGSAINNKNFFNTNPYSSKYTGVHKYFSTSPILLKIMDLDEEKWEELYKFTFVRNPYDRFISGWNYVIKGFKTKKILNDEKYKDEDADKFSDLEYAIENRDILTPIAYNHIFVTQYEHILDKNNENKLDFIGKMENLEKDLAFVLNKLGFDEIKHEKGEKVNETSHKNYKEYYNQKILDFVNEFFDQDFQEFSYEKFYTMEDFLSSEEAPLKEEKQNEEKQNEGKEEKEEKESEIALDADKPELKDAQDKQLNEETNADYDGTEEGEGEEEEEEEDKDTNTQFGVFAFYNFIKNVSIDINMKEKLGLFISSFKTDGIDVTEETFKKNIASNIKNSGIDVRSAFLSIPQNFIKSGSYLNNISGHVYVKQITDYEIPINKFNKVEYCLPILCKNSILAYDGCIINIDENGEAHVSDNILSNALAVIRLLIGKNNVIVYSGGTNAFTEKQNTCILFNCTTSYLNSNTINFFTCMYYSFLFNNLKHTEAELLKMFAEKVGFSVHSYDYFRNDFHLHYSLCNPPTFYVGLEKSVNHPLHCCRITAQIYFLWSLIYYYASTNTSFTIDHDFSIKFFNCIFDNLNGLEIIKTDKINAVFPELLHSSLDVTLDYWVNKINTAVNITNIFILQHAFELIDGDMDLLARNDVSILKEKHVDFEYYARKLNTLFNEVEKTAKVNTLMIGQYHSEMPLGLLNTTCAVDFEKKSDVKYKK